MKKVIFLLTVAFFSYSLAISAQNSGNKPDKLKNLQNQKVVKPEISNNAQKMLAPVQNKVRSAAKQNANRYKNVGVLRTAPVANKKVNSVKPNPKALKAEPIARMSFEERLESMSSEERNQMLQELTPRLSEVEAGSAEEQKLTKIITLLKGLN